MTDNNDNNEFSGIEHLAIEEALTKYYLDYGMSVITGRALPDVRDGLKPVHRRVLFAMYGLKNWHNAQYKKSARIVGDVVGKYHPHGDTAVYDTLVRMAQPFSMKVGLVDGQGNFGSIDGDSPAAMRYTESRMTKVSEQMFKDIDLDTVDFELNYDGQEEMPTCLPLGYPNLLVNGTEGIAVGVATTIPPHNPIEAINCVQKIVADRLNSVDTPIEALMDIMPAPDFPTGGVVHGLMGMHDAWTKGRAKFKIRSKWHEELSESGNAMVVVTEIPYQVNKAFLIERLVEVTSPQGDAKLVEVEGVREIIDESSQEVGLRICIEIKSGYEPEIVFNALAKKSRLEDSFSYNSTVLVDGIPKVLGIRDILDHFIDHRMEVVTRRTNTLLEQAKNKQYLLTGLIKALDEDKLDRVIELIRGSVTRQDAAEALCDFLVIEEDQAFEILDMRLQKLTSSQKDDLVERFDSLTKQIEEYVVILGSEEVRYNIIMSELEDQKDIFSNIKDPDTNKYLYTERASDFVLEEISIDLASLTKEEECTILLSNDGYIRRMPLDDFELQNRGTRGKRRMDLGKKDFIQQSVNAHSHDDIAIITQSGHVYTTEAYNIPDMEKGRYIQNVIDIDVESDPILMVTPIDLDSDGYFVMLTEAGVIKKTRLCDYKGSRRKSGLIGIDLREGDKIVFCGVCGDEDEIIIVNSNNLSVRFSSGDVRVTSRKTCGVKGMTLVDGSKVIGGAVIHKNDIGYLACITQNGLVKLTNIDDYRLQRRGGKGVKAFKSNEKTGSLFKALYLSDLSGDLITTTKKGVTNRVNLSKIRVTSRATSGVKLISIDDNDVIADVFYADSDSEVDSLMEDTTEES